MIPRIVLVASALVFAVAAMPETAAADNNCSDIRNSLQNTRDVVKFGPCVHPTPADADAIACTVIIALVIADGGILDHVCDHRTVKNWLPTPLGDIPLPNTYLSYAGGNQLLLQGDVAISGVSEEDAQQIQQQMLDQLAENARVLQQEKQGLMQELPEAVRQALQTQ